MKFFKKMKDGGQESKVTGYFLVEIKSLFSIVLLRFDKGSREAFHDHAFNAISWVLKGGLLEYTDTGNRNLYRPGVTPIITTRKNMHRVEGQDAINWVFSLRGPWADKWTEIVNGQYITLTHGRKVV